MPSFFNTVQLLAAAALTAAAAAGPAPAQDVTCKPFSPVGSTSTKARIYYYNNNPGSEPFNGPGFFAPTLPANATIGRNGAYILASTPTKNTQPGTAFKLYSCNATSLGLTTNTTQSSCSHGGCYIAYTNYLQVRNPATKHCLTIKNTTANVVSNIDFEVCNFANAVQGQFFESYQQVQYAPGYEYVKSVGGSTFDLIQDYEFRNRQGPNREQFSAWSLDRKDNVTVQVARANYTQVGLSAQLNLV